MNYAEMKILLDPLHHWIQVRAELQGSFGTSRPAFFLNENFEIESVTSEGKNVAFYLRKEDEPLPFMVTSRPVFLGDSRSPITVRYSGCLGEPVGMDNVISESRVELSFHSCYHPALIGSGGPTTYEVEVTLPEAYILLANGQLTHRESRGRAVTHSFRNSERRGRGIPFCGKGLSDQAA